PHRRPHGRGQPEGGGCFYLTPAGTEGGDGATGGRGEGATGGQLDFGRCSSGLPAGGLRAEARSDSSSFCLLERGGASGWATLRSPRRAGPSAVPQRRREFRRRIENGAVELGLGELGPAEIGPAGVG